VDGWVDGWMDGWMDRWMVGWMDAWKGKKNKTLFDYQNFKQILL
jgi:hypothetical protein